MLAIKRLSKLKGLALAAGLGLTVTGGVQSAKAADAYPSKPITVVVGWNAGGGSDIFARATAKYAEKYLGAQFVIVNKPGGGSQVALNELVTRTTPDGYTIAVAITPNMIYQPNLRPEGQSGFKTEQLVQLGTPVRIPSGIMVPMDSPFKNLADVVKFAKENPGKLLIGMNGARSGGNGLVLMFERKAGIKLTPVSYPGGSEQVKAVFGGEIQILNTNAMHQVSYNDRLRPIAFAGERRYPLAPDAPTFKEQGYDIVDYVTRGFVAPPGTPDAIVAHLRKGLKEMANDPGYKEDLAKNGLALDFMDATEISAYLDKFEKENKWVFDEFRKKQ